MKHRPQYLELPLPTHLDDSDAGSSQPSRGLWWMIVGLVLLALFLIGVGVTGGIR
ncbi:MAG: hypothetical protein HY581_07955 [Nitrospirae bacterium]|nr:hypothetical protein [Nitrospirota bacterium]